jgi:5-(carboxyamino)imidazole ribonucleotide synthase
VPVGRQLGLQNLQIWTPTPGCPASQVCTGFTQGDFNDYNDVLEFGKDKDIITIEIEHVNTEALRELERMGKTVHPSPAALETIKDKGTQKLFYRENGIPTAPFEVFDDEKALLQAVSEGRWKLPFVQKTRTAGYDGRESLSCARPRTLKETADRALYCRRAGRYAG